MDAHRAEHNISDRELVAGCINGDESTQELFVRNFSNLVYAAILGVVKANTASLSRHDIEDLHSTVFLKLFEHRCRKLGQYKGKNGCSLASWVRMIAVRTVLDHLRRRKDAMARPDRLVNMEAAADLRSRAPSPLSRLAEAEQVRMMEKALCRLSERDQLMIRMHCLEGCSLNQMAQVLKVSANTIHSVKHRAVQRLKQAVERESGGHAEK
jgi:RNA polymerase sigma factor (sigma-70 family)